MASFLSLAQVRGATEMTQMGKRRVKGKTSSPGQKGRVTSYLSHYRNDNSPGAIQQLGPDSSRNVPGVHTVSAHQESCLSCALGPQVSCLC